PAVRLSGQSAPSGDCLGPERYVQRRQRQRRLLGYSRSKIRSPSIGKRWWPAPAGLIPATFVALVLLSHRARLYLPCFPTFWALPDLPFIFIRLRLRRAWSSWKRRSVGSRASYRRRHCCPLHAADPEPSFKARSISGYTYRT